MSQEKAIPKNISLYPQDWAIVKDVAQTAGMSISQAIRSIIRDWQRMKDTAKNQELEVTNGN